MEIATTAMALSRAFVYGNGKDGERFIMQTTISQQTERAILAATAMLGFSLPPGERDGDLFGGGRFGFEGPRRPNDMLERFIMDGHGHPMDPVIFLEGGRIATTVGATMTCWWTTAGTAGAGVEAKGLAAALAGALEAVASFGGVNGIAFSVEVAANGYEVTLVARPVPLV